MTGVGSGKGLTVCDGFGSLELRSQAPTSTRVPLDCMSYLVAGSVAAPEGIVKARVVVDPSGDYGLHSYADQCGVVQ